MMDLHDQELLDKQLRVIYQPPRQPALVGDGNCRGFSRRHDRRRRFGGYNKFAESPQTARAIAFLDTGAPITRN